MKKMICKVALEGILATWTFMSLLAICCEPSGNFLSGEWMLWEVGAFLSASISALAWRLADRRGWLPSSAK